MMSDMEDTHMDDLDVKEAKVKGRPRRKSVDDRRIEKAHNRLEKSADAFLDSYEAVCRKHKIIVDSGVGTINLRAASSDEITQNIAELRSWLVIELTDIQGARWEFPTQ